MSELLASPLANGRSVPTQAGGFPVLRLTALRNGTIDLNERKGGAWTREDAERFLVRAGDFLIARGNGSLNLVGRGGLVGSDPDLVAFPDTMIRVRPDTTRLEPRYLAAAWTAPATRTQIEDSARTTAGIYKINQAHLGAIRIPVPPLAEQRRVVELVADHLSRLDAADVQLAVGLHRVDSLRVASMRRALGAQPDWEVAPIGNWLDSSIGGLWGNPPGTDEIDVRVVRVTEMKAWGRIAPGTAAVRSITARQLAGRALEEGDLLLEKSGGGPKTPVGRVGLIESLPEPSICANFMQLMRPDRSRVNPRFLYYTLNAFHLSGGTAPMQTASTNIRNIKASEYLRVEVALPSLEQQERLVTQIQAEQDAADRLARAVVAMQIRNAGLRRSLLAAAFSGRLSAGRWDLYRDQEAAE
ncbi:hypothetical protein [Aeromicrobium sp. Root344]|uniref:restriction endonuclease subunit S n=1 Tax=Aeromicrobium sp. Root344 TaxID=1736521 RepID=UPI0012F86EBD|nr:hypothetical protein [Aeromicrobium sp. Root344]